MKVLRQLQTHYYWQGMGRDVQPWYRQCDACAKSKGPPTRLHGHLQKIPSVAPFDLVTVDILSRLLVTVDGSRYLLVLSDAFTKWVEAYPLSNQEAATCMRAMYDNFFFRFGLPRQLHSDKGRNFASSLVQELCQFTGIHRTRTTAFRPRSNGVTERANRKIIEMLRASIQD